MRDPHMACLSTLLTASLVVSWWKPTPIIAADCVMSVIITIGFWLF